MTEVKIEPPCEECGSTENPRSPCPLCRKVLCQRCAEGPEAFCCDDAAGGTATRSSLPSFARAVGDSFRLEVDEETHVVTLVIVPVDVRAVIPEDVFCRFAIAVADVLGHLNAAPNARERRAAKRKKQ